MKEVEQVERERGGTSIETFSTAGIFNGHRNGTSGHVLSSC